MQYRKSARIQVINLYIGPTFMVCADITKIRRCKLGFVIGIINAHNYVKGILRLYIHRFAKSLGSNFTIMHDNKRLHTTLRTRGNLEQ